MKNPDNPKLIDFIRFINWRDIAYVALAQLLLRFGFINLFNFETLFTDVLFFLLFFSVLFLTISGYLINSYSKTKQTGTLISFVIFFVLGLLLPIYVSYAVQKPENILIFLGFAGVIALVSINLVNRSFVKTIAISMLMAFSMLINWWYNEPTFLKPEQWPLFLELEVIIIIFSLLLFMGNLARSMIYSLKKQRIDKLKNKETFPNVFGVKRTKQIIFLITMLSNVIIFSGVYLYATKISTYLIILPAHIIPQLLLLRGLYKAKTSNDYKKVLYRIDLMIVTSILFIPIVGILIKLALPC